MLPASFAAAYVNVALNTRCRGGSKLVVDDRPGSRAGAKLVAGTVPAFEAALVTAQGRARVVKLKGWLDAPAVLAVAATLERHLAACPGVVSVVAKAAEFEESAPTRAAVRVLAGVLVHQLPAAARVEAAKGVVVELHGGSASVDALAELLCSRCRLATLEDEAWSAARPAAQHAAKLKLKVGCLDGAVDGASIPGLREALVELRGATRAVSVAMPSDAISCAAAAAGRLGLQMAGLVSVKLRGRLSDAAVACVLGALHAVPRIYAVKLVRHQADAAHCEQLVAGLLRCDSPALQLACKRKPALGAAPGGSSKHSWELRRDGACSAAAAAPAGSSAIAAALCTL